jgi:hypothetical protein
VSKALLISTNVTLVNCLLFKVLVFINDIADGMTGLGRLFADDTSIGHIANDKDSLQDMVNLDLAYLKDWSKRCLVKFNQNKIMVFIELATIKPNFRRIF